MLQEEVVLRPPSNMAERTVKDQWCPYYQNVVCVCARAHNIVFVMQAGVHEIFQKFRSLFKMVGVRR